MPKLSLKRIEAFAPGDVVFLEEGRKPCQVCRVLPSDGQIQIHFIPIGGVWDGSPMQRLTANRGKQLVFADLGLKVRIQVDTLEVGDYFTSLPNRNRAYLVKELEPFADAQGLGVCIKALCSNGKDVELYPQRNTPVNLLQPLLEIPDSVIRLTDVKPGQEINIASSRGNGTQASGRLLNKTQDEHPWNYVRLVLESRGQEKTLFLPHDLYVEVLESIPKKRPPEKPARGHLYTEMWI